jgi:hypothetical protein
LIKAAVDHPILGANGSEQNEVYSQKECDRHEPESMGPGDNAAAIGPAAIGGHIDSKQNFLCHFSSSNCGEAGKPLRLPKDLPLCPRFDRSSALSKLEAAAPAGTVGKPFTESDQRKWNQ